MLGSLRVFLTDKNTVIVDAFQTRKRVFNNTWKLRLEFQPLTLLYTIFFTERVLSCTPFTDQWYPRFTCLVKNVASPLIAVN